MKPISLLPIRNTNVTLTLNWQIFSPAECAGFIDQASANNWDSRIPIGPGNSAVFPDTNKSRSVDRQLLPLGQKAYPLDKITFGIGQINAENWRYDLTGIPADDMPWMVRQQKTNEISDDWEVDLGDGFASSRKLSYIIQLSDPKSYEGGDLEIWNVPIPGDVLRQQGTIIVFPAYSLHRMTPVTKGQKHYIAGWIHGNNFR